MRTCGVLRVAIAEEKMAWDKDDDDDSGSVLLGAAVRPKGLDFDREKCTAPLRVLSL
jgi:hypothetical protein